MIKQLLTLFLMLTVIVTFTQKVTSLSLFERDTQVMAQVVEHCDMENMSMVSIACPDQMLGMENCPSDCEMMNIVSVIHFIEYQQVLSFEVSQLNYPNFTNSPPYHFSETLYRPPFLS